MAFALVCSVCVSTAWASGGTLGDENSQTTSNAARLNETRLTKDPATELLGRWKDDDYGGIVEVTESAGVFTGRMIRTPLKGVKPGTHIFRGLKYFPEKNAWKGRVYAPRRDSTYDVTLTIKGSVMKMKVTFGPLWKTVMWRRPS